MRYVGQVTDRCFKADPNKKIQVRFCESFRLELTDFKELFWFYEFATIRFMGSNLHVKEYQRHYRYYDEERV